MYCLYQKEVFIRMLPPSGEHSYQLSMGPYSLWISWMYVIQLRRDIATSWWLQTTSANGLRPSRSRRNVQTRLQMCWWKRSYYDSACLWLYIATRVGSLKMTLKNPYVHCWDVLKHESTGYSPFCLMMGEECSLPQDVSTSELRTNREHDKSPHTFATWVRDALEVAYYHVRESLHRTAAWCKRLYDVKAVNRKFPIGSWACAITGGST